jgi:hypothetical protein
MKVLCNVLAKIEAGSETKIRESLDQVLGMWSGRHGTAHTVVAVSENSVAFADADRNLFVARYAIGGGKAVISDVRKLLNIGEELESTSFLDEFSSKFIEMIAEDKEDEASKLIGTILEMKQNAINGTANTVITEQEAKARAKKYVNEQRKANSRILAEAKKQAKKKVFKKEGIFSLKAESEVLSNAFKALPGAAVALIASLDFAKHTPVIEGFVTERSETTGLPLKVHHRGSKTIVSVFEKEECEKDEKEEEKKEGKKHEADEKKGKKVKEEGKEDKKTEEAVVVANLSSLTEFIAPGKDFFNRASVAWRSFRADPISEEVDALLKNGAAPAEIVKVAPFLALLGEDEVYEAIVGSLDAFDPNDVKELAKKIVAEGVTPEGLQAKKNFIDALADGEVAAIIESEKVSMSTNLDRLFLEGEDFDFGASDDLGSDDLGNDNNIEGMGGQNDDQDGDEIDMNDDQDPMGDDQEVQFSMPVDKAREMFKNILDVVADEIEDSDEFQDLKSRVEDDEQELTGDDVTAILQTISDYFQATGKAKTDADENNAENNLGGENLDDMASIKDTGGNTDGSEDGDGNDMGVGGEDDNFELGK